LFGSFDIFVKKLQVVRISNEAVTPGAVVVGSHAGFLAVGNTNAWPAPEI